MHHEEKLYGYFLTSTLPFHVKKHQRFPHSLYIKKYIFQWGTAFRSTGTSRLLVLPAPGSGVPVPVCLRPFWVLWGSWHPAGTKGRLCGITIYE